MFAALPKQCPAKHDVIHAVGNKMKWKCKSALNCSNCFASGLSVVHLFSLLISLRLSLSLSSISSQPVPIRPSARQLQSMRSWAAVNGNAKQTVAAKQRMQARGQAAQKMLTDDSNCKHWRTTTIADIVRRTTANQIQRQNVNWKVADKLFNNCL